MGPPLKRIKLIPVDVSKKRLIKKKKPFELTNLNAQCLESILKWLPFNDLYSISQTNKKFQKLAGLKFQRDYPNNSIIIDLMSNNTIQTKYEDIHDLRFSGSIRNVTVSSYIFERDPIPLFDYLKVNCCQNLKELHLYRMKCGIDTDYSGSIRAQLKQLEIISFDRCIIPDIHKQFLVHCQNLKHLRIKEKGYNVDYGSTWKNRHYAQLQSLTFWGWHGKKCINLGSFLSMNRNIKNVNCMDLKAIKAVIGNTIELNQLVLHCETEDDFFGIIKLLNQRNHIKNLELVLHFNSAYVNVAQHINTFGLVESFRGFHDIFTVSAAIVTELNCFDSFDNLRTISLKLTPEDENNVWQLSQRLPFLEQARIYLIKSTVTTDGPDNFKPLAVPFIFNLKHLTELIISFPSVFFSAEQNDIVDLNKLRKFGTKLTIYMDSDIINKKKFTIPTNGIISIKPISHIERRLYKDPFLF